MASALAVHSGTCLICIIVPFVAVAKNLDVGTCPAALPLGRVDLGFWRLAQRNHAGLAAAPPSCHHFTDGIWHPSQYGAQPTKK